MNDDPLEDGIRSRDYFSFRVIKKIPLVCVLKDDNTMIVIEAIAQKIIKTGTDQGQIFATNSVTTYTSSEVRKGNPLQQEQDLEFDTIQNGELVCKMDNGGVITIIPVVVQINRSGIRLPHGEEQYDVVSVAKVKIGGKLQ